MDEKELQEKLASGEYSISPRSGRLRKKFRTKKKKSPFSKRKIKKSVARVLWILMILAFLVSLFILIPEMNQENTKNKWYDNTNQGGYKRPQR
jgi:preprotein translocase subunit SecG